MRAPATSRLPASGLSSPEASGRSGLLMRSISMSSSWLRPVMYTFISSAAGMAYSTPWSSGSDSAAPAGAAYNVRAGMHTADPSIVCGREKRQSTCSSDDGRGSAAAISAVSGSLSSSLCWATALRGGLATATLRRQRGARVGRAGEVAEPVDSAWTRTPESRRADTKIADISPPTHGPRFISSRSCGEIGPRQCNVHLPQHDVTGPLPSTLEERCMQICS